MKEKLRILMLGSGREHKGGVASVVNMYYSSSLLEACSITYLATHCDGSSFKKIVQALKASIRYLYLLSTQKYDLIHIHGASRASLYRKSLFILVGRLFKQKIIFHLHGAEFLKFYYEECTAYQKRFIRFILNQTDCIISLSKSWQKELQLIVKNPHSVHVISNPIPVPEFHKLLNHINSPLNILFLGRLGRRKGIYDLIDVVQHLKNEGIHDFIFQICGDGEVEEFKNLVRDNNLNTYFEIPGWINNKENYLKEADIFILPSYNEGQPISILEAASYALPVVSTPVGGIGEIITDGVNGFLVEPGDTATFAARIKDLIVDTQLRENFGKRIYQTVKENFELNKITVDLNNLYKTVIT